MLLRNELVNLATFFLVVYEVASFAVATESCRVEGLAQLCLVLGMTVYRSQLLLPVGELTPVAVPAEPALFERTTQLRLVSAVALRVRLVEKADLRASVLRCCLADPVLLRRPEALIILAGQVSAVVGGW